MAVSPLMLALTNFCRSVAPVISATCGEPMEFAVIAWPKDRPDKPTVIATNPSRREVNAAMGCAIDVNRKAAAAAGDKDH